MAIADYRLASWNLGASRKRESKSGRSLPSVDRPPDVARWLWQAVLHYPVNGLDVLVLCLRVFRDCQELFGGLFRPRGNQT